MKKIIISLAVMGILSGCSQTQMNDLTGALTDTLGSLITVDTGNGDKTVSAATKDKQAGAATVTTGHFNLTVPQDVDTVFASVVNEFDFPSPEYLRQKKGDNAGFIMGDGFYHFEQTPGSYYHLGYGYLKHKTSKVAIEMKLLKAGKGTKIIGEYESTYYEGSKSTLEKEIIARIKNALK